MPPVYYGKPSMINSKYNLNKKDNKHKDSTLKRASSFLYHLFTQEDDLIEPKSSKKEDQKGSRRASIIPCDTSSIMDYDLLL